MAGDVRQKVGAICRMRPTLVRDYPLIYDIVPIVRFKAETSGAPAVVIDTHDARLSMHQALFPVEVHLGQSFNMSWTRSATGFRGCILGVLSSSYRWLAAEVVDIDSLSWLFETLLSIDSLDGCLPPAYPWFVG